MLLLTSALVTLAEMENMLTAEIRIPSSSLCGGGEKKEFEHPPSIILAQSPQDKMRKTNLLSAQHGAAVTS